MTVVTRENDIMYKKRFDHNNLFLNLFIQQNLWKQHREYFLWDESSATAI